MNTITAQGPVAISMAVRRFEGGTLVRWGGGIYVVVLFKLNSSNIGAISLSDGGYLDPDTLVTSVSEGEVIEIVAGKVNLYEEKK